MTISAWINKDAGAGAMTILDHESSSPFYGYYLLLVASNVNFEIYTPSANTAVTGGTALSASTWYYVAGVYDGSNLYAYVNGASDATPVAKTGSITYTVTQDAAIGIRTTTHSSNRFSGTIDEVRLASSSRTAVWLLTEFSNQNDPANFYAIGAETPA
jgi:hypothetical protein